MTTSLRQLGPFTLRGAGSAYPGQGPQERLTNAAAYEQLLGAGWRGQLEARGLAPDHPESAWGIRARAWARGTSWDSVGLAVRAVERALEHAGWNACDLVVAATCTPTHVTKCFAAQIAHAVPGVASAVDVRGGGAGGLDALVAGCLYVTHGARRVVVVAAETASRWIAPGDHAHALLFGDGAGALALEQGGSGSLPFTFGGVAQIEGTPFTVPGSLPPTSEEVDGGRLLFQPPDRAYLDQLDGAWATASAELASSLAAEDLRPEVYLPYAVTRRQLESSAAALGCDAAPARDWLADHGCLGCASTLAQLADAHLAGRLPAGATIASLSVGGGVRWTGLALRI